MSNQKFNAAVTWLKEQGGFWHPNLERRADENGVYGIYAKGEIKAGETLCRVPKKCGIFYDTWKSPDDWNKKLKLTYSILCEKRKVAKGQKSDYQHVLDSMPTIDEYKSFHPHFLSDEEHKLLNEYSPILNMLHSTMTISIKETITKVKSFDKDFSDEQIIEAIMLNNTRSWFGMYLPVMDMFNHSIRKGIINSTSDDESLVKAKLAYQEGEQVYISYGNKDMLVLACEYGFYDKTDYPIALPLVLNYSGNLPLNFAVARLCIEEGMKGVLSEDFKTITVGIEDLGKMQQIGKLICFSPEGISKDLYQFFQFFAINNYKELEEKQGTEQQTLTLLEKHLTSMIGEDKTYDRSPGKSSTYLMLLDCLEDRLKILKDCRDWVRQQLKKF